MKELNLSNQPDHILVQAEPTKQIMPGLDDLDFCPIDSLNLHPFQLSLLKLGHLSLANGVLQIDNSQFHVSDPAKPVRETLPVKYDPKAQCEVFLKGFLAHILKADDIDLLQRYLSQTLEGINHSQSILVLTGDAGWGKSSLMKILGALVGWKNVGIIREQLFRDEFELAHYHHKHFLFHPDMPTDFLDRKEASIFKQLVGGDPLWANVKGDDGRMTLQDHYPVILACNGKPRIHLDSDTNAWMRRLVVLSLKTPTQI